MDRISAFTQRNPVSLAREIGKKLRALRLAKGWTQEELAERAGVALSTLKLFESKGHGSLQRLIHLAIALDADGGLREWFAKPVAMESIEAVKLAERRRAPARKPKGADHGN